VNKLSEIVKVNNNKIEKRRITMTINQKKKRKDMANLKEGMIIEEYLRTRDKN